MRNRLYHQHTTNEDGTRGQLLATHLTVKLLDKMVTITAKVCPSDLKKGSTKKRGRDIVFGRMNKFIRIVNQIWVDGGAGNGFWTEVEAKIAAATRYSGQPFILNGWPVPRVFDAVTVTDPTERDIAYFTDHELVLLENEPPPQLVLV